MDIEQKKQQLEEYGKILMGPGGFFEGMPEDQKEIFGKALELIAEMKAYEMLRSGFDININLPSINLGNLLTVTPRASYHHEYYEEPYKEEYRPEPEMPAEEYVEDKMEEPIMDDGTYEMPPMEEPVVEDASMEEPKEEYPAEEMDPAMDSTYEEEPKDEEPKEGDA